MPRTLRLIGLVVLSLVLLSCEYGLIVPVESITVVDAPVCLSVGGSYAIVIAVEPADATETIVWESADPDCLTVDSSTGEVVGTKESTGVEVWIETADGRVSANPAPMIEVTADGGPSGDDDIGGGTK